MIKRGNHELMRVIASMFAAVVVLLVAGPAAAQDNQCQSRVEFELKEHGLSMEDMSDVQWQMESFAAGQHNAGGTLSGYSFYARPSSCSSGQIVIEMWPNCGVQDIFTQGGCNIKGVFSAWF